MTQLLRDKALTLRWTLGILAFFLVAVPSWAEHDYGYAPAAYPEESSYSFARVVEGSSTILTVDGEREEFGYNQPILVGDTLWVPEGSRLEAVLADRNLLRVEGDAEILFQSIAYSSETQDTETGLRVTRGELQLVVPRDALGEALPRIDTPDASIYVHREGSFRITVSPRGYTELVVREGLAELVADRGSLLVHAGEAGRAEGYRDDLDLLAAGYRDGLERWGDRLSAEAARAEIPYVDRSLRYAAAPLASHGGWVEVGGSWGWRPRVEVAWQPYSRGYWRHTPVGYTWVSHDPWGYVTHHYGSWDYHSAHGWLWYPGRVWAPARVHWYWGPSYVGWCPSGYYARHYGHRYGHGLRFGIYGWAGGGWGHFSHWSFTLTASFGHHHGHRGYRDGHYAYYSGVQLARQKPHLDRGVITTHVGYRGEGTQVYAQLRQQAEQQGRLPDVTGFVGRQPLDEQVAEAVVRDKPLSNVRGDRAAAVWQAGWDPDAVRQVAAAKPRPGASNGAAADGSTRLERMPGASDGKRPAVRTDTGARAERLGEVDGKKPAVRTDTGARDDRRGYAERGELTRRPTTRPERGDADRGELTRRPTTRPERGDADRGELTRRPTTRPERGDVERRPTTRPDRGEITRRPTTRPERGDADRGELTRRPTTRPERGDADRGELTRRPTTRPERGDVDRRPTTRPDRGELQRRPTTRPERGSADRQPTRRPERGSVDRQPTRRPERGTVDRRPAPRPTPRAPSTARPNRGERSSSPRASSPPTRSRPAPRASSPSPSRSRSAGSASRGGSSRSRGSASSPSRSSSSRGKASSSSRSSSSRGKASSSRSRSSSRGKASSSSRSSSSRGKASSSRSRGGGGGKSRGGGGKSRGGGN